MQITFDMKSVSKQRNFVFLTQTNSLENIFEATTEFAHFAFNQDSCRSTLQLIVRFFSMNPGLSNR